MRLWLSTILLCADHFQPGQSPDSWQCRLASFESTTTGKGISLTVQFCLWFGAFIVLRWLYTFIRSRGTTPVEAATD